MQSAVPHDSPGSLDGEASRQFVTGSDGIEAYIVDTVWQSSIDRIVEGSPSVRCKVQLAGKARYVLDRQVETTLNGANVTFLHSPLGSTKHEQVEFGTCERSIVVVLPIEDGKLGGCSREDEVVDRALRAIEDRRIVRQGKLPVAFGMLAESILRADRAERHFEKLRRVRIDELACLVMDMFLDGFVDRHTLTLTARERRQVSEARDILLSDLCSPATLKDLARAVGSNRTKLNQGFRSLFGESAFQLLRRERMLAARRLLQTGTYSVTEVAERCGYDYIGNFSLAFKSYFGVPPSVTRRQAYTADPSARSNS